jgi:hypothetical protein
MIYEANYLIHEVNNLIHEAIYLNHEVNNLFYEAIHVHNPREFITKPWGFQTNLWGQYKLFFKSNQVRRSHQKL